MKTTLEIPGPLFRKAKSTAAARGQTLKDFVTEALQDKLRSRGHPPVAQPRWMAGFGGLRSLRRETARVQERIDAAFEVIDVEDRE